MPRSAFTGPKLLLMSSRTTWEVSGSVKGALDWALSGNTPDCGRRRDA
jgi:hypothetical protein